MTRRVLALALLLAAVARAPAAPAAERRDVTAFRGQGAWVDVYDWSRTYTRNRPKVTPATVDVMAAAGVQTLYLQAAKDSYRGGPLVDPDLLRPLIDRARARGIRVVAWYLPTLVDPSLDLVRLRAMATLPVQGIGVDIESRAVRDVTARNDRLVKLSADLRASVRLPLSAVTLAPVHLEVVNPSFWPGFPWRRLAPYYDAWQPMGYWGNRTPQSGWRDGYRYTVENVRRLRANVGDAGAVVHPVGSPTSAADIRGMKRAVAETAAVGGSVYDWQVTPAALRPELRTFHDPDAFGRLDTVTGSLLVTVAGWAIDPDTTGPVDVDLYVDGARHATVTASRSRPDVERAHPGYGAGHGFETTLLLLPGRHVVCATARNVGYGSVDPSLGCLATG